MSSAGNQTILVTGATGNTGSATIKSLADKLKGNSNVTVRAGVRDEKKASEKFSNLPIKLSYANTEAVKSTNNLSAAFKGVNTVVILPPGPDRVEVSLNYIREAVAAKVGHIVLLSVATADNTNVIFGKQWNEIEKAVKDSGISYTFVRAPFFFENQWGNVGSIKGASAFYYPAKPTSEHVLIAVQDIGEAIATVALNTDKFKNKTYTITSDETYTNEQVAAIYSELLGKPIAFYQASEEAAMSAMVGMGFPEWQSKGVVELWNTIDSKYKPSITPTTDFKDITGKSPLKLKQFLQSIIGAFQ